MSFTNNIYIPYIEGFHNLDKFLLHKKYYEDIGFNVKIFGDGSTGELNYSKMIKDLIVKENEEVFVIIDNLIIPSFSIHQGIDICMNNKSLVKPTNKTYMIEGDDDENINNIITSLKGDEILENFNYSYQKYYKMWPMNGSWIINKNIQFEIEQFNIDISSPTSYDFDLCYRNAIFNNLVFIQCDSYKINPIPANVDNGILLIYKDYLESIANLFGLPENIYLYKNQVLEKLKEEDVKDIFNIDKYFSSFRYI